MKILSNMATVELSDSTTEIEFLNKYRYFHVQNLGDAEIKMSLLKDADTDGSISCLAGNAVSIPCESRNDKFYISGAGKINVIASDSATNPYRVAGKGGGGIAPGPTPSPEVLDFLPHPEGIYGYWDYEHGVENTTWTDMVNRNVLTCNLGGSFSVDGNTVKIIGNVNDKNIPGANLNLSKNEFFTLYLINQFTTYGQLNYCSGTANEDITLIGFNTRSVGSSIRFTSSFSNYSVILDAPVDTLSSAIIRTPGTNQIVTNESLKEYTVSTGYSVAEDFGLSFNAPVTAVLLSTETNNIDYIRANMKALEEKYFPT